ncbi:Imm27 family immunity protein [Geotalea sp. SG265]|uniref:Imm27 family immunity protein n=1 Tax=Geotalea sp. SG265 TaxID=2922867 RepID=UPI001FAF927C|nr:Imm27 family immunity protein [Geotalea sp. SG265]
MFEELKPEEKELVGMWLDLGLKVTGDAIADRVEWLTATRLQKLAEKPEEGAELYRDPQDNRLWEKVLPFVGGPPTLRVIAYADAAARFGFSG